MFDCKQTVEIIISNLLVGVTKLFIKTGTRRNSNSDAVPTLEICDSFDKCCKTADLDNAGNDRENGKTDIYHNGRLGSCKQVVASHILTQLTYF